jgi:SAM-dependent methyltransferase
VLIVEEFVIGVSMEDGTPGNHISDEEIESLNAHGPYTMAVWRSGDIEVGNEEGLKGRSAYFIERIRETILKNFTLDELKALSIVDIGCNDGWVLHQLSDLPFAKMVGIEPRQKNIDKGKKVRAVLGLQNNVDYRVGDLESIGDESFDIVICAGVLYHVESIPESLRNLRNICKKMLFIESRCLASKYITDDLKYEIEMRDLVYQYKDKICGITGQKFESAYHDGSTNSFCVVNVPSVESLYMYLDFLGFENIDIVADPETYRAAVWKKKRPLSGVCMAAFLNPDKQEMASDESSWIIEYERGLEQAVLPRKFVEPLYNYFCLGNTSGSLFAQALGTFGYLTAPDWLAKVFGSLVNMGHNDKYELEIIKNLRYSPHDKLCLEYGKLLHSEGKHEEAIVALNRVSMKLNADWRAVYRSFWLLSQIYKTLGNEAESERYKGLCLNCNPEFPV